MKKLLRNEKGSVIVLAAAGLAVLVTISAVAIDYANYTNVNTKFSAAADNALLSAAASARTQSPADVAKNFFRANFMDEMGSSFELKQLSVSSDPNGLSWNIDAAGSYEPLFGGVIGMDRIELSHSARVVWDTSKLIEVVFAVDTSSSMCMDVKRSRSSSGTFVMEYQPDASCKKLNAMKESLRYVVQHAFAPLEVEGGPLFKIGIVPFNHKVRLPNLGNIPLPLAQIETTHAKGSPAYYTNLEDAEPLAPVVPLTGIHTNGEITSLVGKIDAISQSPLGLGWTRSNIGLLTSALMLDPDYNNSFGGLRPERIGSNDIEKVVVLMTDGANIGCCFAAHPEGNFDNQYLYLYEVDNAHMSGMSNHPNLTRWQTQYGIQNEGVCDQMKQAGITIYSVVFDVDDRDPGGAEIKETLRRCSSNKQFFFDVKNSKELKLAYETIAQSFIRLRVDE
jgi:Flp pilus assembly protein TadG